jgi:hypothetical protein
LFKRAGKSFLKKQLIRKKRLPKASLQLFERLIGGPTMDLEIKKATNIRRTRLAETGEQSEYGVDEIFEEPWDEMVIRFDKDSHQFVVQRVIVATECGQTAQEN